MKIKSVSSIWPNGSDAHWLATFENGHTLPITKENAHWIIDEFRLKNMHPSGEYDENDNIVNTFEPFPEMVTTISKTPIKKTCLNCRHWRDKAWTDKGWGICDNEKNEVRIPGVQPLLGVFGSQNEWVIDEIKNGIRYPEDFGCIFFEPNT